VIERNERFTDAWTNHHRFLLDVAYRLLGSYSDAEDIVQEAFSRLLRTSLRSCAVPRVVGQTKGAMTDGGSTVSQPCSALLPG